MRHATDCEDCAALREEVEYLRGELGLRLTAAELDTLRVAYKLSANEARALLTLAKAAGRPVTAAQLEEAMPARDGRDDRTASLISSVIRHIRVKVGEHAIQTVWGHGYRLSPSGLDLVASAQSMRVAA